MIVAQFDIETINDQIKARNLRDRIVWISNHLKEGLFSTSFSREDQVILHHIAEESLPIRIITLQTGRLFRESLDLLASTKSKYGVDIEEYRPDQQDVENYVDEFGINGFYTSVEARKVCCSLRKVVPLNRAMEGAGFWITGLTRAQSEGRRSIPFAEWDEARGLVKLNPIADMTDQAISEIVKAHNIPINPLHARGYPSIGCEPCTRAIRPGEHPRAGRWWWEKNAANECGLHRNVRAKAEMNSSAEILS